MKDQSVLARPSGALLCFFLVLFIGAMVLGPVFYDVMSVIHPVPFHRCMDRALLISALAGLAVAWPRIELRVWWRWDSSAWKQALLGLVIALVGAQAIVGADVALGSLEWAPVTSHDEVRIILTALAAALLVPLAEETIFRGFIQTELVRGIGLRAGLMFGALIYMIAHFFKVPAELDHVPVHWWSGVGAVGDMFLPVIHGQFLDGRGLNLFILGLILGGVFLRWGTLWLNYGLHAGLVVALILTSGFTRTAVTANPFLAGDLLSQSIDERRPGAARIMAVVLLSKALAGARDWGECALNLAFPWPDSTEPKAKTVQTPFCRQCGYPYAELPDDGREFACSTCEGRKWHFEWARAAFLTEGDVHEAVVGFKYSDQYYQLSRLVAWLTKAFDRHAIAEPWDALVPVPLYHRRRRTRGFNQALELAQGLGRARNIAVSDCLYRYRETPSQTGLQRGARWENVSKAFRLKAKFDVKGKNLLLIDDVFTTGATTNACAHVLAQAGAGRLAVLTVSRS